MHDPEVTGEARRYYAATCPVCRELALKTFVAEQVVQFECGRCGSFGVAAAARSTFETRSEEQRKEWLAYARQQVSADGQIALVDAENEPKA